MLKKCLKIIKTMDFLVINTCNFYKEVFFDSTGSEGQFLSKISLSGCSNTLTNGARDSDKKKLTDVSFFEEASKWFFRKKHGARDWTSSGTF